jgi:hypothetical protein
MKSFLLATLLTISPAAADEWQRYENEIVGYAVDIPPGLVWRGEDFARVGQVFTTPTLTLVVEGRRAPGGFEAAIREWREWEVQMGWNLVFEMTTPSSASASAKRPNWLLEMRALPVCGDALVLLQLEYGVADAVSIQPILARLASSLKATRKC